MFLKNFLKKVVGCAVMTLLFASQSFGQLVGVDAYMIGDHVEIGINGSGGHEGAADLPGSHSRSNISLASPVYFGFVANPQLDGWAQYDGDFFTPGSPENSFGMEIQGINYSNSASGFLSGGITGGLVGYEEEGDCITVEWEGVADSVRINIKYHLLRSNLFYTTEVTMTNESGLDLTDVYYYRNVDPDNNVTIGGGYPTINTIVAQPDSGCHKALVSAEQTRPAAAGPGVSYVGFGALGDNFRVARGGFFNRDASDIWDGVGVLTGTVGSSLFSDQAIAIAYKSDISSGESINFTFATVLSGDALEAAFQGLYYVSFESLGLSGGGVVSECSPAVDTAKTCGGSPVILSVEGPDIDAFEWEWSPADGLSETMGPETEATPTETITYTVTGTPLDGCFEEPIVKTIVVEYLESPELSLSSVGANCEVANGSASATVSGGTEPYEYLWSTGDMTADITDVFAGIYSVTVTDANGCTVSGDIEVEDIGPVVTVDTTIHGVCEKCETETMVIWSCENPNCVEVLSTCKDLSNVVLVTEDGEHEKFDGLSGLSGTFCATNGEDIVAVYVKSGCYRSGDGPGYGYLHENPLDCDCGEDDAEVEPAPAFIREAADDLLIYPNPTNGQFRVQFVNIEVNAELVTVEVYNARGERLAVENISPTGENVLDYSHLNNGVYFLRINTGDEIITRQITLSK